MTTSFRITTPALLLALSAACAFTCTAADSVPYDLSKETYKTETLISYEGCLDSRLMANSGEPKVFKNHVYVAIIAHGLHPRVLQVPLDGGGEAKIGRLDPDFKISNDSHCYFTLGVDKAGYIHLTGGMHGGAWKYWISAKPEDVSKFIQGVPEQATGQDESALEDASDFVATVPGQKGAPPGFGITYPHFYTDPAGNLYLQSRGSTPSFQKSRQGKIVHIGLLSTYDADQRAWRLLGADIPKEFGGHPGHPVTVWGDNFENGPAGSGWYISNSADFVASPDNTLHFVFRILNYSSPTGMMTDIHDGSKHAAGKDILYAWSKDGGRTLHRADGSKVEWPVQAEAGPHQADVVYAAAADYAAMEKAGNFKYPGLAGGQIQLDWKGRPMILAHKPSTNEAVAFRLENGKWGPCPPTAFGRWRDKAGVLMNNGNRFWDQDHSRAMSLGQGIGKIDEDYLRDTGRMIYTTPGGRSVIKIMRTTIQRPIEAGKSSK